MHKVVRINESQVNRLFTIRESSGVNDVMFKVADLIARQISFSDIFKILSDTSLIDEWHEDYDTTYDNYIEYNGYTYKYSIFYDAGTIDGTNYGNSYGKDVDVNFYTIERVFMEYLDDIKPIGSIRYSYFNNDEDEDEFDSSKYSEELLYSAPGIEYEVYTAVYPIILHELTHTLDNADPIDRVWIKPTNRYNDEDVREFMYLFSDSEMNARVASAAALLSGILKLRGYDEKMERNIMSNDPHKIYLFREDIMPIVMKSRELKLSDMETLVGLLESNSIHYPVDKEYLESCMVKPISSVYSLAFHLAINDEGLYKGRKPRSVLKLYASNPEQFEQKVISFYKNLLEQYKKRIYKVCWYIYTNYPLNSKEFDDEYERTVKPFHKKIWGENT